MRIFLVSALLIAGLSSCGAQATVPSSRGVSAAIFSRPARGASLKNSRLFVSDAGSGNIYLYAVPSLKLITILQGFTSPQGECADTKGDVWVADNRAAEIYQLSYSGRTMSQISDTTGYPVGCAWDSTTGNLAVTNFLGTKSQGGGVSVYRRARGAPNTYTNPSQFYYDFAGYDDSGNLFFDGSNAQGNFVLSELPSKTATPITLKVSGATIYSAGMVQWDPTSKYLDIGDQDCNRTATSCLYQLDVSGKSATVVNTIALQTYEGTPVCDLVQGVISGGWLFGSDNDYCGYAPSATNGWAYPAGGSPTHYLTKNASQPIGAALAVKPAGEASLPRVRPNFSVKKLDLLYVSQSNGSVAVYTYWQKTLVRTLTGFSNPQGECVDKNNNVYITDAGNGDIVEYAHDGKVALRTIDDTPYSPYACAIDFTTGNLAVANESGSTGNGNIAIYAKATGSAMILSDSAISGFQSCVYDDQGNLLASSNGKSYRQTYFAWLPAGGTKLVNISIPGTRSSSYWEGVEGLQWDGRYFVLDVYYGLARIAIQNGEAYYIGGTYFQDEDYISGPGWIYDVNRKNQGTQFVGLYFERSDSKYDGVVYANYPAGNGFEYIKGIGKPNAVAVSLGKLHE